MTDDNRYEAVSPYAMTVNDDYTAERGDWRGELKVRIRIPSDMPAPLEILGVVLTPEVTQCVRVQDKFDVSGWLDAMIYYQPLPPDEPIEQNIGEEGVFAVPPPIDRGSTSFDDYFMDLDRDDSKGVMEVEGVEKYLVEERKQGEQKTTSCLSSRVPFSLLFDTGINEEPSLSPQIHSVECLIRGSRLIDLEVAIDMLLPARDSGLSREMEEAGIEDTQFSEETNEAAVESEIPEESNQIQIEQWDEPEELFMDENGKIERVEVIQEFDYPVLGLGYSSRRSPRRPSRIRETGEMEDGIVRPRSLAGSSSQVSTGLNDGPPEVDEIKSKQHRNSRRQTTIMRFHFDG